MKQHKLLILILVITNLYSNLSQAETSETASTFEQEQLLNYYAQTLFTSKINSHNGKWPRAANFYKNTDKTKIDSLFGIWSLQYTEDSSRTDTLELERTVNDADFGYYGWDSSHVISCFYEPNTAGTIYSYQCLHLVDNAAGIAQRYVFNLNGNTLTGKYFKGTIPQFFDAIKNNKLLDLRGSKTNTGDSKYDDNSKILSIPKVNAFGKAYRVILIHEGNGLFRLQSADAL